jgi:hypothetical protein
MYLSDYNAFVEKISNELNERMNECEWTISGDCLLRLRQRESSRCLFVVVSVNGTMLISSITKWRQRCGRG